MKAVGVIRHLFYTSKMHVDSSGTKPFDISIMYTVYIRNESFWCG